jgi:hypothetical protein
MLGSIGGVSQCLKFACGCTSRRGRHNRGSLSYETLGQVDDETRMRDTDARRLSVHEGVEVAVKDVSGGCGVSCIVHCALCNVDEVIDI